VPDATASDVGEFGLIAAVVERLTSTPSVVVGPGDDAAVVLAPDGRVVATTDVLVEGVHFRLDWSTPYDVGRKAAAASLADVAAMGGTATSLLVGLAAPPDVPVSWAVELADGLRDEADVGRRGRRRRGHRLERPDRREHHRARRPRRTGPRPALGGAAR
jgi:thiamine-monophosphate kinase